MRRIRPADLVGTTPVWCLDLHHGGTTYRVASEPIDVKADDGTMLSYSGGLDPVAFNEQLGRLKFTTPDLSATIRAILPVSVAKLSARGHDWLGATADLYLTVCQTADRRLAVPVSDLTHGEMWLQVSGRARSPSWGDPSAPPGLVEFSLEVAPWNERSPVIRPDKVVSEERFTGASGLIGPPGDEAIGKLFPLILGAPGTSSVPGAPVYAVERDGSGNAVWLMLALGQVQASTVRTFDSSGAAQSSTTVLYIDSFYQEVTYCSIGGLDATSEQFYASWTTGAGSNGYGSGLSNAVQAAAYLLSLGSAPVDTPAWLALATTFAGIEIGGYVNDDSTAWDVVQSHILPLLPVAYRYTRQGLSPVVYDPALRSSDTVAHVRTVDTPDAESSGDWTPVGPVSLETEPEDVPRQVTINFAKDAASGQYTQQVTWLADANAAPDPRDIARRRAGRSGSVYLDQAVTRGTGLSTLELDFDFVWDADVANQIASWRGRLAAMPTLSGSYLAPLHWGWLQVGDSLTVTDPLREFTGAIGVIDGKRLTRNGWEFVLVFTEDPVRDDRVLD